MSSIACFVDTSAWFALLIPTNDHHAKVRSAYVQAHKNSTLFVTTTLVLGELYTMLATHPKSRLGFWAFREKLLTSNSVRVQHVTSRQVNTAYELLQRRPDKAYSFVDATSFVVMRDESIASVLTLDPQFAPEGFTMIPSISDYVHEASVTYNA